MMKHTKLLLITLSIAVVVVVGLLGRMAFSHFNDTQPVSTTKQTSKSTTQSHTSGTATPSTNTKAPSSSTSSTAATTSPTPQTQACKLLTLTIAKQILGAKAQLTASSTPDSQTTTTAITTCAYTNNASGSASEVISLTAHTPRTAVGSSENNVTFGSGKPAGVSDVSGFGQTAFWDPGANQLNILSNGNWYIISGTNGSPAAPMDQAAVEAAAQNLTTQLQ